MSNTLLINENHPLRKQAEAHIKNIYLKKYTAFITEFPPLILALTDDCGKITCAAGVRFSTSGFFSNCYLSLPLEQRVSDVFKTRFSCDDILEITTLASNKSGQLFPFISEVIKLARKFRKPVGIFTITQQLQKILLHAGMPLVKIASADISAVSVPEQWGSYYTQDPAVFAVLDSNKAPLSLTIPGEVHA